LSTKIHAAVDALGNPVRFLLSEGQASEYTLANELISGLQADYVITDKGYDSDSFVEAIHTGGAEEVIPPRGNRKSLRNYDKILYKDRNLVERLFQKLKNHRRVATRYERLVRNYKAMLVLVASVIWLA